MLLSTQSPLVTRSRLTGIATATLFMVTAQSVKNLAVYRPVLHGNRLRLCLENVCSKLSMCSLSGSVATLIGDCTLRDGGSLTAWSPIWNFYPKLHLFVSVLFVSFAKDLRCGRLVLAPGLPHSEAKPLNDGPLVLHGNENLVQCGGNRSIRRSKYGSVE